MRLRARLLLCQSINHLRDSKERSLEPFMGTSNWAWAHPKPPNCNARQMLCSRSLVIPCHLCAKLDRSLLPFQIKPLSSSIKLKWLYWIYLFAFSPPCILLNQVEMPCVLLIERCSTQWVPLVDQYTHLIFVWYQVCLNNNFYLVMFVFFVFPCQWQNKNSRKFIFVLKQNKKEKRNRAIFSIFAFGFHGSRG